jgi:hypothetical protein
MRIIIVVMCLGISFSAYSQNMNTGNADSLNSADTTVYEVVDTAAHFPGGKQQWYRYLEKTLNANVGVENGAKTGTYRVKIRLTVLKDGTLQDFKPESKYGHGFEQEVIRSLKLSPKWVPAMKNGVPVNSTLIHTQIFSITSGR